MKNAAIPAHAGISMSSTIIDSRSVRACEFIRVDMIELAADMKDGNAHHEDSHKDIEQNA